MTTDKWQLDPDRYFDPDPVQRHVARELYKTHPDRKVQCIAYVPYQLPPEKIRKENFAGY